MSLLQQLRKTLTLVLIVLATTAACSSMVQQNNRRIYRQLVGNMPNWNGETAQLDKILQLGCPNS